VHATGRARAGGWRQNLQARFVDEVGEENGALYAEPVRALPVHWRQARGPGTAVRSHAARRRAMLCAARRAGCGVAPSPMEEVVHGLLRACGHLPAQDRHCLSRVVSSAEQTTRRQGGRLGFDRKPHRSHVLMASRAAPKRCFGSQPAATVFGALPALRGCGETITHNPPARILRPASKDVRNGRKLRHWGTARYCRRGIAAREHCARGCMRARARTGEAGVQWGMTP